MEIVKVPVGKENFAEIDLADEARIRTFTWHLAIRGRGLKYASTSVSVGGKTKNFYMHRLLLPDSKEVHHRDGDGLNNRRCNLVATDRKGNSRGFQKKWVGVSSKYRGVCWKTREEKWEAYLVADGKQSSFGQFSFETEAALVRDREAIKKFGAGAHLNFPRGGPGNLPTVLFVGYGRAGKDAAAEYLGRVTTLKYAGSFSWSGLPFMADFLGVHPMVAWETRHQHRQAWKNRLDFLRAGDQTFLAQLALAQGGVAAGLRDKKEIDAVRAEKLFTHLVWVNRPGTPVDPTVTFTEDDADWVLDNDGTLEDFHAVLDRWAGLVQLPRR